MQEYRGKNMITVEQWIDMLTCTPMKKHNTMIVSREFFNELDRHFTLKTRRFSPPDNYTIYGNKGFEIYTIGGGSILIQPYCENTPIIQTEGIWEHG